MLKLWCYCSMLQKFRTFNTSDKWVFLVFGVVNVPNIWHLAHLPHQLWMLLSSHLFFFFYCINSLFWIFGNMKKWNLILILFALKLSLIDEIGNTWTFVPSAALVYFMNNDKVQTTISFLLCLVSILVYILNLLLYPKMFFLGFK